MSDVNVDGARAAPVPQEIIERERLRAKAQAERGLTVERGDYRSRAEKVAKFWLEHDTLEGAPDPYPMNAIRFAEGRVPLDLIQAFGLGAYATFDDIAFKIERELERRERAKREARR